MACKSGLGVLIAICHKLLRSKTRVACGTVSHYACRWPVLNLKIKMLGPYASVLS